MIPGAPAGLFPHGFVSYRSRWDSSGVLAGYLTVLDELEAHTRLIRDMLTRTEETIEPWSGETISALHTRASGRLDRTAALLEDIARYGDAVGAFVRQLAGVRSVELQIRAHAEANGLRVNEARELVPRPDPAPRPPAPVNPTPAQASAYADAAQSYAEWQRREEAYRQCQHLRAEADDMTDQAEDQMRDAITRYAYGVDEVADTPRTDVVVR